MIFELEQEPQVGDKRCLKKFAFFPVKVIMKKEDNSERYVEVWLENYCVHQVYKYMWVKDAPLRKWSIVKKVYPI